jgi:glutamate--cysteine ligase
MYTGLLYDDKARDELEALIEPWTYDEVVALRPRIWREGLGTPFRGERLAQTASKVLDIAKGGLSRRARKDARGRDESVYMDAIVSLVSRGLTPADELAEQIGTGEGAKQKLVALTDLFALA